MSEIGKRTVARITTFLRGSHAAERLFLRGAFAALGFFFAYAFVVGHWSALAVIALCALGYKANVEPRPHVGHGVLSDPRPLPVPPPFDRKVADSLAAMRKVHEWQGALSPLPVIAGTPYANALVPTLDDIDRAVDRMGGDCRKVERVTREMRAELSEREVQRRSFAFGNASISNPSITRADIDRAADAMLWDDKTTDTAVR
jgi:hypothetical protein